MLGAKRSTLFLIIPKGLHKHQNSLNKKRRETAAKVIEGHVCDEIEDSRHIPSNWREHLLNCRNCKQNLVLYLSKYYLKTVSKSIMPGKGLILAGCFEDPINAVPQHGVLYEMEYLSQTHY